MRIRNHPIPFALLAFASPAVGQIGSAPIAPVVLARATFVGEFDTDTAFNTNVRLESRTISPGVHETWVVLDGTATTDESSYDLDLEFGIPSGVTLTVQQGPEGTSLIYADIGSNITIAIQSSLSLTNGGNVAIVTAEELTGDFWLSGAVTDNIPSDSISVTDAYQSYVLLAIVSTTLGARNCEPQWTDVHGDARNDCNPGGIKSFSYSCNPQTGAVSFSWECKASS